MEADFKADGGLDFILTTDQTFMGVTLSQLDALLVAFPALRTE